MNRIARMVKKHHVKGWDEFEKLVTGLETEFKKPVINVFFTGDKDELGQRYASSKQHLNPL